MHGFALNVNSDLSKFKPDHSLRHLSQGSNIDAAGSRQGSSNSDVQKSLVQSFADIFNQSASMDR